MLAPHSHWRLAILGSVLLALGGLIAPGYARVAVPYYQFTAQLIASSQGWYVDRVQIVDSVPGHPRTLQLVGRVYDPTLHRHGFATVTGVIQIAAVLQGPLVFIGVVLLLPAGSWREWRRRLLLGLPVLLLLDALTTVLSLLHAFAEANAIYMGEATPTTPWEIWTRVLESGGRIALAGLGGLATVGLARIRDTSRIK